MKDCNKARSKVFGFIEMKKHAEKDITDGMEKLIKKRTVIQKVMP